MTNDKIYRDCVSKLHGNCPYVRKNKYNVYYCSIDHIIQVTFFGCTPHDAMKKYKNDNY